MGLIRIIWCFRLDKDPTKAHTVKTEGNNMQKTALNIRIGAENKKQLVQACHAVSRSLTEVLLTSANSHFVEHYIGMAKTFDRLYKALEHSDDKDTRAKAKTCTKIAIEKAEYFQREVNALTDATETLKEIESLECYRDFLRETVTVEA